MVHTFRICYVSTTVGPLPPPPTHSVDTFRVRKTGWSSLRGDSILMKIITYLNALTVLILASVNPVLAALLQDNGNIHWHLPCLFSTLLKEGCIEEEADVTGEWVHRGAVYGGDGACPFYFEWKCHSSSHQVSFKCHSRSHQVWKRMWPWFAICTKWPCFTGKLRDSTLSGEHNVVYAVQHVSFAVQTNRMSTLQDKSAVLV